MNSPPDPSVDLMEAALAAEASQDWRQIGLLWLQCAAYLAKKSAKFEYTDEEGTLHRFPQFDANSWMKLSELERLGRAYRYAGYHFEGDGDRQSSYALYKLSAECFEHDRKYDEASRSYYLALVSYARRFGDIDELLLAGLQKSTKIAVNYDERTYLRRLVIYFRRLGAVLSDWGNHGEGLRIRRLRLHAEAKLMWLSGQRAKSIALRVWGVMTDYGQGLTRWSLVFGASTFIVFPILYFYFGSTELQFLDQAVLFSAGRAVDFDYRQFQLTTAGVVIALIQSFFTLGWLGGMITIFVNRLTE